MADALIKSRVKLFLEGGMAPKRPAEYEAEGGACSAFRLEPPLRDVWKLAPARYGAPTGEAMVFVAEGAGRAGGIMQHFRHGTMYARHGWGCWFEDSELLRSSIKYGTWPNRGERTAATRLASAECAEAQRLITARLEADSPAGRVGKPRDPGLPLCEVLPGGWTVELDGTAVPWGTETLIAVPHLQTAVRLILGFRNTWARQPYLYGLPLEDEHDHPEGGTAQAYQRGLMRWERGRGEWWTPNGRPGAFGQVDASALAAIAWGRRRAAVVARLLRPKPA